MYCLVGFMSYCVCISHCCSGSLTYVVVVRTITRTHA